MSRSEYWANVELSRATKADATMEAWLEVNRRAAEIRKARDAKKAASAAKAKAWWRF